MRRAIPLSVVLVLLSCCCCFGVIRMQGGALGSANGVINTGPFPQVSIGGLLGGHAQFGTDVFGNMVAQREGAAGLQIAGAAGVGGNSGALQLMGVQGTQLDIATNAGIVQAQTGNLFVGQLAAKTGGPGWASATQALGAGQGQTAFSPFVGQATQNQSAAVTQHAYVSGAPGSTAVAGGGVAISTSQSSVVTN
jgi:hypothetical protein